jgi:hypothetical protein
MGLSMGRHAGPDRPEGDARWGRLPGAAPPLSPRAPLAWWGVSAVVLAVAVLGVVGAPGPLDDPHEGDQRPGILIDPAEARTVASRALPGVPVGRRPVVLVFDRRLPAPPKVASFLSDVPRRAAVAFVVPDGTDATARPGGVRVVSDPAGRVARQVGMPRPNDGGPPVGYAVLDHQRRVRYATLDPEYPEHGFEVEVVAGALG